VIDLGELAAMLELLRRFLAEVPSEMKCLLEGTLESGSNAPKSVGFRMRASDGISTDFSVFLHAFGLAPRARQAPGAACALGD